MVTFKLHNIGLIESAEISLNDLTIICGQNNTGKTYITYSIFGFLDRWSSLIDFKISRDVFKELDENGFCNIGIEDYMNGIDDVLKQLSIKYTKHLDSIFSTDNEWFANSNFEVFIDKFELDLSSELESNFSSSKKDILQLKKDKDSSLLTISVLSANTQKSIPHFILNRAINQALGKIFFGKTFKKPFIITSERTGISLFHTELDINRNVMVEHLTNSKGKEIDPFKLFEENISRYAMPIRKNIDFRRELEDEINKNKSFLYADREINSYFKDMLNGAMYKYIKNEGIVLVTKKIGDRESKKIPMYLTSSASKSLLDLYAYITRFAKPNEILMIDEPELNLHPDNHIIMARLLSYLANHNINIFITTHSDYMIKEFNNLIRLKHQIVNKKQIMKEYKYKEHDRLNYESIAAYINDYGSLRQISLDNMGMEMDTFDETINRLSSSMDDIFFNIKE